MKIEVTGETSLGATKGKNVRILLLNTGGIEFMTKEQSKESLNLEKLRGICNAYQVDIVCLTKINKDWRVVEQQHTIWNATASWR